MFSEGIKWGNWSEMGLKGLVSDISSPNIASNIKRNLWFSDNFRENRS